MIRLTYSNRTEALLDALVRQLHDERSSRDPLEPVHLIVPNRNVERYVEVGIARRLGVAANLRFGQLAAFVEGWLEGPLLTGDALTARVLRALFDAELLARDELEPVRRYLEAAGGGVDAIEPRRAQLAVHLSRLFEEYGYSRVDLLDAWARGERAFASGPQAATEAWQAALHAHVRDGVARPLHEALAGAPDPPVETLHVFGLSYVARVFSELYAVLGERADLHLYALNPCEEFWEDLETDAELRRRRRRSDAEPVWVDRSEDPFGLSVDTEQPLLRAWGRPGREHVRLLDALTDCDFVASFVDPRRDDTSAGEPLPLFSRLNAPTLLEELQHDVLTRAPRRRRDRAASSDESLAILACPGRRREVETVAAEIWRLMEALEDLTFDQIAVLVNGPDRDVYLPHVEAVFEEARAIPFNVADLSLASVSPVVEGALRLLALPATRFSRPEVLAVITHPAVRARFPDVRAHEWVELTDRLGIFHGLDHDELRGTYVGDGDLLSWEQGITRIALGAFARGPIGAEPRFVEVEGRGYLPEEPRVGGATEARFALLARSLSSDVRFAREAALTLGEWSRFAGALLRAYLTPAGELEEAALRRALGVTEGLARLDLGSTRVRWPVAWELLRGPLEGLVGARGQHLADGVAVSSLMPMRAIPFRVIFVLGLGEGRFPASDRRDSMDLRAARRRAGDVSPPERDRYTFLETLLCARERLVLSYVARDERTGDPLAPCVVIGELLDVIEAGYLPDARGALVRRVPLRRHAEPTVRDALPEAAAEEDARQLGDELRAALGDDASGAPPATMARRVARDDALERRLGLSPLPRGRERADEASTIRISLGALRRFLECPLQGWTSAVLRLDDEDASSLASSGEEPLEPSRLDETMLLRASFTDATLAGVDPRVTYERRVAALTARGRWPLGPLARLLAEEHAGVLARWSAGWSGLHPQGARRVRFGAAASTDGGVEPAEPIRIVFPDDPRNRGSGRSLTVELTGSTELLTERASVSLLLDHRSGEQGRVAELREGLRAFFDHAALATMATDRRGHDSVQLYADRDAPVRLRYAAIDDRSARDWLQALVDDLLGRAHPYLFPIDAVLRLADRFADARGAAIVDSIEHVRERWGGGQSRWGPVRDATARPAPAPGEAEAMAERRFGPWLRRWEAV